MECHLVKKEPAENGAATPPSDLSDSKKDHAAKKRSFDVNGDFDAERRRRSKEMQKRIDEIKAKNPRLWGKKKESRYQETDSSDSKKMKEEIMANNTQVNNPGRVSTSEAIRKHIENATRQVAQKTTVTQRWVALAEELDGIEVALVNRNHTIQTIERQLNLRSRDQPTNVTAKAIRDILRNQNAVLDIEIKALEKTASDGNTVLVKAHQESQSIAHQIREAEEELKRVTKLVKDKDRELEFTVDQLVTVTRDCVKKKARREALEMRLTLEKDKLYYLRKEKHELRMNRKDREIQLRELYDEMDHSKERFEALDKRMDKRLKALSKARKSIRNHFSRF